MHDMHILGITGSIASGKTYIAGLLSTYSIPLFSADACVQDLLEHNREVKLKVASSIPESVVKGEVSRVALRESVNARPILLSILEKILHPFVSIAIQQFLCHFRLQGAPLVALEVPLLFETGLNSLCHEVWAICVTPSVQRERLHKRAVSYPLLYRLQCRQYSTTQKKYLADWVIYNYGYDVRRQVMLRLQTILGKAHE